MDYMLSKEVEKLKQEQSTSSEMLEADKFSFQHLLENEMGKQMMDELRNPKKPSLMVGLRNRYRRWKTIRDNARKNKKIKKGGF